MKHKLLWLLAAPLAALFISPTTYAFSNSTFATCEDSTPSNWQSDIESIDPSFNPSNPYVVYRDSDAGWYRVISGSWIKVYKYTSSPDYYAVDDSADTVEYIKQTDPGHTWSAYGTPDSDAYSHGNRLPLEGTSDFTCVYETNSVSYDANYHPTGLRWPWTDGVPAPSSGNPTPSANLLPAQAVSTLASNVGDFISDNWLVLLGMLAFIIGFSIVMAALDIRSENKALEARANRWKL